MAASADFASAQFVPVEDGVGFDEASALFLDGGESGLQGGAADALAAVFLVYDEAGGGMRQIFSLAAGARSR